MSDRKGDFKDPLPAEGDEGAEEAGISGVVGAAGFAGMLLAGAVAFGGQAQASDDPSSKASRQDASPEVDATQLRSALLQLVQRGPYPPSGSPWDNWQNFDNWQNY